MFLVADHCNMSEYPAAETCRCSPKQHAFVVPVPLLRLPPVRDDFDATRFSKTVWNCLLLEQ